MHIDSHNNHHYYAEKPEFQRILDSIFGDHGSHIRHIGHRHQDEHQAHEHYTRGREHGHFSSRHSHAHEAYAHAHEAYAHEHGRVIPSTHSHPTAPTPHNDQPHYEPSHTVDHPSEHGGSFHVIA